MTTHRPWAGALIALVALTPVTACGGNDGTEGTMHIALTQELALEQLRAHLDDTLATLPAGVSLTRTHPELGTDLGPAHSTPCDDSNAVKDGPLFLTASYWVDGVPVGEATRYHDILVRSWTDRGWPTLDRSRSDTRGVNGEAPDGFRITADVNAHGDLVVAVVSPCFPRSGEGEPGDVAAPAVIEGR